MIVDYMYTSLQIKPNPIQYWISFNCYITYFIKFCSTLHTDRTLLANFHSLLSPTSLCNNVVNFVC